LRFGSFSSNPFWESPKEDTSLYLKTSSESGLSVCGGDRSLKAVILVGGEGTRMRPLSCHTPKPMLPLVNRPFIEYIIGLLKKYSIAEIILSSCYLADEIKAYFGKGTRYGINLTYVVEGVPLGTGGAIKNVEPLLDGTFLVFF